MPKRLLQMEADSDSTLTSVPESLSEYEETVPKVAAKGSKRKVTAVKATKSVVKKAKIDDSDAEVAVKVKKTTKKKAAVLEPLEERTADTKLRVGAHVSIAGGVHHAIANVIHIGANAFALFLKNQRKWVNPEMDPEHANLFLAACKEHNIAVSECCVPHGSYLVNLAHPDADRKKQAYDSFINDLARCTTLGVRLYNFHPGNSNASTREVGIKTIAENLNRAHKDPSSGKVITLLETMASQGNTIGGTFKDIADIIALVDDKSRVGVCLDTCHVFAAGYDLRTPEAYAKTMDEFDAEIGLKYLMALHINDSKAPLASCRDLHARIGTGYLGLYAFHNIVNDARLHGLPMVLETPNEVINADGKKVEDKGVWAREIKILESLVGMDAESDEFLALEKSLQAEGEAERGRIGAQVEKRKTKAAPKKKGKKKADTDTEPDDED